MPSITISRDIFEKLREIARKNGLSYSEVIKKLLENNSTSEVYDLLKRQVELLEQIYCVLCEINSKVSSKEGEEGKRITILTLPIKKDVVQSEVNLPDFIKDNPWLTVLGLRSRE